MSEIKFRCWDIDRKAWLNEADTYRQVENQARWNPEVGTLFVLQQYTGLHDKNGKEIYEGDIVKDSGGDTYEVQHLIYPWMSAFRLWQTKKNWSYGGNGKDIEVIGNIWEGEGEGKEVNTEPSGFTYTVDALSDPKAARSPRKERGE